MPRPRLSDTTYTIRLWGSELGEWEQQARREGYEDTASFLRAVMRGRCNLELDPDTGRPRREK